MVPTRLISLLAMCALTVLTVTALTSSAWAQKTGITGPIDMTADADAVLADLLTVLKDDAKRAALIAHLETLQHASNGAADGPQAQSAVPQRMADRTAKGIENTVRGVRRLLNDIGRIRFLVTALDTESRARIGRDGAMLFGVVLVTMLFFTLLYKQLKRIFTIPRISVPASTWHKRSRAFLVQLGVAAGSLSAALLVGYATAYLASGTGGLAPEHVFYLNGFLVVSAFSIALRFAVSGDGRDITFSSLPRSAQAVIFRWVNAVFATSAYTVLTIAPIAQLWTSFVIARSMRSIGVMLAFMLAIAAILRIRRALKDGVASSAGYHVPAAFNAPAGFAGDMATRSAGVWHAIWPWLAALYAVTAFLIAVFRPNDMIDLVWRGTLYSAAALGLVMLGLRCMAHAGTLRLPEASMLERVLPGFSTRINGLLAPVALAAMLGAFASAGILLLEGWGVLNLVAWLSGEIAGWLPRLANAAALFVLLALVWALVASWIDRRLARGLAGESASARTRTLLGLLRNAFTIAVVTVGLMTMLSELGVDIAPLVAGAGVIGLAIGFGAQKLVQDIITGIFIQLENAINEGDVVGVGSVTGGVEKLTIRSVSLRGLDGVLHIIPFSAVDAVSNYTRHFAYHVADIGVGYAEKIPAVKAAMTMAFDRLTEGEHGASILAPLEMHGVVALGDSAVTIRARIKTKPGAQWAVGRAYTEHVKEVLDERGIEIPFPHREIKLPKDLLKSLDLPPKTGEKT